MRSLEEVYDKWALDTKKFVISARKRYFRPVLRGRTVRQTRVISFGGDFPNSRFIGAP